MNKTINRAQLAVTKVHSLHKVNWGQYRVHPLEESSLLRQEAIQPYFLRFEGQTNDLLLFEGFKGEIAEQIVPITIEQFYAIAEQLLNACEKLHEQNMYLKALPTSYVIIDENHQIKLMPMYWVDSEDLPLQPLQWEFPVAYLAPEHSDWLTERVTAQTDLYAIGYALYELVGGEPPQGDSINEVLYNILQQPLNFVALASRFENPQIIAWLSKMVAKHPTERYESVEVARKDLQQIKQGQIVKLTANKIVNPLAPYELIGREVELQTLKNTIDRIDATNAEVLFISGHGGCGKTALVQRLKLEILRKNFLFFETSFLSVDGRGVEQALQPIQQLVAYKLQQSNEVRQQLANTLQKQLMITPLVLKLFPQLQQIAHLFTFSSEETFEHPKLQQQFIIRAVQKIIEVFTADEQPVVLFYDDAHMALSSTIEMIQQLYMEHTTGNVCVVFSYRNEQPLKNGLQQWQYTIGKQVAIQLSNLEQHEVLQWISSIYPLRSQLLLTISSSVYTLTKGQPLFVKMIVQYLLDQQLVYYASDRAEWQIDVEQLQIVFKQRSFEQFMMYMQREYAQSIRQLLMFAASFQSNFDIDSLQQLTNRPIHEITVLVEALCSQQILMKVTHNQAYRFKYELVRESILVHVPKEIQQRLHFQIAQLYIEQSQIDVAFIYHYEQCDDTLKQSHKEQLLQAHKKLANEWFAQGFLTQALIHYELAKDLLSTNYWVNQYEEALEIYIAIATCLYCKEEEKKAFTYISSMLQNSNEPIHQLKIYRAVIQMYTSDMELSKVRELLQHVFQLCALNYAPPISNRQVNHLYIKQKLFMKRSKWQMNKQMSEIVVDILAQVLSHNYPFSINEKYYITVQAIQFMNKYGETKHAGIIYIHYATILACKFKRVEEAFEVATKALKHVSSTAPQIKMYILTAYSMMANKWMNKVDQGKEYANQAQFYAIQCKEQQLLEQLAIFNVTDHWIRGASLQMLHKQLSIERANNRQSAYLYEISYWNKMLIYEHVRPTFQWPAYDALTAVELCKHQIVQLQMAYLFNDTERALELLNILETAPIEQESLLLNHYYYVYRYLWSVEFQYRHVAAFEQRILKKARKESLSMLKKFAYYCPENYSHFYLLLKAEVANEKNKLEQAVTLYEQAIEQAISQAYLQDAAVIAQRLAYYYLRKDELQKAKKVFEQAKSYLLDWGAINVVKSWEERFYRFFPVSEGQLHTVYK